jgi:hypothetical protein
MVSTIYTDCEHCGTTFGQPYDPGRRRRFCSGRCRTAAYRARKRRQEQVFGVFEDAHEWWVERRCAC